MTSLSDCAVTRSLSTAETPSLSASSSFENSHLDLVHSVYKSRQATDGPDDSGSRFITETKERPFVCGVQIQVQRSRGKCNSKPAPILVAARTTSTPLDDSAVCKTETQLCIISAWRKSVALR